jgi:hypothetical protein
MKKRRYQPRPPVGNIPATMAKAKMIAAQEANIIHYITLFRDQIGDQLLPEGGHEFWETFFFEKLVTFDGTVINDALSPEDIVKLARAGHPAADRAVFRFADKAMVVDRFQELPMPVREYVREHMRHGQMSFEYPPRTERLLEHFVRDCAIAFILDRLVQRLPIYRKKKKGRRSAAALVGEVFGGLSEVHVKRIYEADQGISRKVNEFFANFKIQTFGVESNV